MPRLSAFLICKDEEELVSYALDSFVAITDLLDVLSVVDNGSSDATRDIIDGYTNRLPIVVQTETRHAHHGHLRDLALSKCGNGWVYYLDSDETFDSRMVDWLHTDECERIGDVIEFYKYTTILDRYHYVEGGNGPCHRMFRNSPGTTFPQEIHTDPILPVGFRKNYVGDKGPFLFDHTACKSWEGLWAKGWKYMWANRLGVPAVGNEREYVWRVETALSNGSIREFPDDIRGRIFTGPGFRKEG